MGLRHSTRKWRNVRRNLCILFGALNFHLALKYFLTGSYESFLLHNNVFHISGLRIWKKKEAFQEAKLFLLRVFHCMLFLNGMQTLLQRIIHFLFEFGEDRILFTFV